LTRALDIIAGLGTNWFLTAEFPFTPNAVFKMRRGRNIQANAALNAPP